MNSEMEIRTVSCRLGYKCHYTHSETGLRGPMTDTEETEHRLTKPSTCFCDFLNCTLRLCGTRHLAVGMVDIPVILAPGSEAVAEFKVSQGYTMRFQTNKHTPLTKQNVKKTKNKALEIPDSSMTLGLVLCCRSPGEAHT